MVNTCKEKNSLDGLTCFFWQGWAAFIFFFLGGFGFGASQILDRDGRVFDFQRYISRRIQFWNMSVHLRRSLLFKFQRPCNSFFVFFCVERCWKSSSSESG